MIIQHNIACHTIGRSTTNITDNIQRLVKQANFTAGLCHLFLQHTSASLILCENADSDVRKDLEMFISSWIKDGDPRFKHRDEGSDDMSAHLRTIFTHSDLTIPITEGSLALGQWQGIFLYEHRQAAFKRNILVTLIGE